MITPLPNSSVASPATCTAPAKTVGAAPVMSSVACSWRRSQLRPAKSMLPVLSSEAAVTVVEAEMPVSPISRAPELVRSPPIVAVSPPPKAHVPPLSSKFVMESVVPSSSVSVAPESMVNCSAAPEEEIGPIRSQSPPEWSMLERSLNSSRSPRSDSSRRCCSKDPSRQSQRR